MKNVGKVGKIVSFGELYVPFLFGEQKSRIIESLRHF